MARPHIEKIIAEKTVRLDEFVKGGMDLKEAKHKVISEKTFVDWQSLEIIRRRVMQTSLEDLAPKPVEKPKSFWARFFGF